MESFFWDGQYLETSLHVADAVTDIVRRYETYGDSLEPMQFLDEYGKYIEECAIEEGEGEVDGRHIARLNIGYMCGDLLQDKKRVIYQIFDTEHPYFGTTDPTPEEAFAKGKALGEKWKAEAAAKGTCHACRDGGSRHADFCDMC